MERPSKSILLQSRDMSNEERESRLEQENKLKGDSDNIIACPPIILANKRHRIIRKHFLLIQIITIRAIEITDRADRFKHHIKPQRTFNL